MYACVYDGKVLFYFRFLLLRPTPFSTVFKTTCADQPSVHMMAQHNYLCSYQNATTMTSVSEPNADLSSEKKQSRSNIARERERNWQQIDVNAMCMQLSSNSDK